jgi:hypothetical protein
MTLIFYVLSQSLAAVLIHISYPEKAAIHVESMELLPQFHLAANLASCEKKI